LFFLFYNYVLYFSYKAILDSIFKAKDASDFIAQLQAFVEACKWLAFFFLCLGVNVVLNVLQMVIENYEN